MGGANLAKITSELAGKPYKLAEAGGYDCASLILAFMQKIGAEIRTEWEGFTTENYAELYKRTPEQALEVLACWVSSVGVEIPASKAFTGDILIGRWKRGGQPAVIIHGGQDQGIIVNDRRGVTFVPLRAYEFNKAIRWRRDRRRV